MAKPKILFVSSYNIARGRTAEYLLLDSCDYEVMSAGFTVNDFSGQLIKQGLVDWADIIILMDEENDRHLTLLKRLFNVRGKKVKVLGIPNIYRFGDPVLITLLKAKLARIGIKVEDKPT